MRLSPSTVYPLHATARFAALLVLMPLSAIIAENKSQQASLATELKRTALRELADVAVQRGEVERGKAIFHVRN